MPAANSLRTFSIVIILLLSSCSSTYKPVMLQGFSYQNEKVYEGIQISYAHNLQYLSKNKWYTKKERKFGMIAVAVRVENNSDESIELSPANLKVRGPNGEARRLYTPMEYGRKVRQRTGRHLLHALYGPWAITVESSPSGGITDTDVIYIPVGALIGIGNAFRARKANGRNIETLERNAIWNRIVDPGEVVYGTILMDGRHGEELTFAYVR